MALLDFVPCLTGSPSWARAFEKRAKGFHVVKAGRLLQTPLIPNIGPKV